MAGFATCFLLLWAAEPFQKTLIDRSQNLNPPSWQITSKEVCSDACDPWKVTKSRLVGGKQEGVDIVEIDNGRLRILVIPTRGMGIWHVIDRNFRIGWESPVKEIVHPSFVSLPSRGGLGWLEGFGEFLCRCGLENNGHPGKDTIKDNTGAESSTDLTLHGKQAYLPVEHLEINVEKTAPYRITLKGIIPERMMHGPKFRLETSLTTEPGSNRFRIEDKIINESASEAEYQILYHTNFGPPLLEKGSECIAPTKKVVPFNDRAAQGDIKQFAKFDGPQAGFVEQVYCMELFSSDNTMTLVGLTNQAQDRAVSMKYRTEQLPYLTLWKNTTAREDGYVTGIEPGTNYPYNRHLERIAGRVPKLAPKGSKLIEIEFEVLASKEEVQKLKEQIASIQNEQTTEYIMQPNPPKAEAHP
jgi:hypothetical protein